MTENTKIFGIGFHKTGTTSLAYALKKLGYSVMPGMIGVYDPNISENVYDLAFGVVPKYDAFQDNPWPIIFRELDEKYPGSKFILTIRPRQQWIKSQVKHFGKQNTPMREWIYGVGCPEGNEEIYIARYEQHNKEVLEYFKDRPKDLLVLNITEGEGWEKLCPFLGKDIPDVDFPKANTAEKRAEQREKKSQKNQNNSILNKLKQKFNNLF